ncbi:hypothetical protein [Paenibacillus alvei]|uniref:hypothetical protein n=1 Tax=Paenibacillus alvei TaxID=44250 RepID=UPI0018CE6A42|nr:hypothetical protein [Paenibacillus alvei]MBG9735803.1 hypothetical protein [Paenibacillus alvei]MBG9743453.1 hypothetical protein [Paenibacillus alvei]MCY9577928.1 hypothetical protein [Paenibacillus alvei]MCY9587505.1 hypothetical protein [Paenibacillus alvei]
MDKKYINELMNEYFSNRNTQLLELVYVHMCEGWSITGSKPDEWSIFNETFMKVTHEFRGGDFVNLLSMSFRNARINYHKHRRYRERNEEYDESRKSENENKLNIVDTLRSETDTSGEVIINLYKKKEAQQRQLLNFLLESAKIQNDQTMTAIIEGLPRYPTVMALAKALGLQRNTVDRKLRRLARNYNPEIHGDILDYFPDGVRIKREFLSA